MKRMSPIDRLRAYNTVYAVYAGHNAPSLTLAHWAIEMAQDEIDEMRTLFGDVSESQDESEDPACPFDVGEIGQAFLVKRTGTESVAY